MSCYQNWHKEEDRSNYNELTMLPKAAISVIGSFRETQKLETPNCKHSVSDETENSKVQTLSFGAKVSKNSPVGYPSVQGGEP